MYKCNYCEREFDTVQGRSSHSRVHKNKKKVVTKKQKKENPFHSNEDQQIQQIAQSTETPTVETYTDWLNDYKEQEEEPQEQEESIEIDQAFALTIEQYMSMYELINSVLDTLITILGGDETFSQMKKNTLTNIASQTKAYADSMNVSISAGKMLALSIGLAYVPASLSALNSVRINRKSLRQTNMKAKELENLQKDVKIEHND